MGHPRLLMALSPHGFRTALVTLAIALLGLAAGSFWHYGSSPTDENVFTRPPSAIYLGAGVAGQLVTAGQPAGFDALALRPGDFVLSVDRKAVFTLAEYQAAVSRARDRVRVIAVRDRPQNTLEAEVDAEALRRVPARNVASSALVVDVTPGGASARAGLRVGDLIVRINGQSFASIFEADAIMRRGTVGRSTDYEIVRATQPLTLRVTLANFGLRLALIVFSLAGVVFILAGLGVGLARPWVPAARYWSLSFVLLGYAVSVLLLRRPLEEGGWATVRDVSLAATTLLGIAVAVHAGLYFPRERSSLLARRWVPRAGYGLAIVSLAVVVLVRRPAALGVAVVANLLFAGAVRWMGHRDLPAETREIVRPIERVNVAATSLVALVIAVGASLGLAQAPGFAGLILLAIPAVHLWTIGRYRLFDLDLRVRRSVQYSLLVTAWSLVPIGLLTWLVLALPRLSLPVPNVRLTGSSVEVLASPLPDQDRVLVEKVVLMLAAIGLAFGMLAVARRGRHWLASKFYRAEHDYRRAAKEVSKLVTARPDLEGLASGLVAAVVRLLQVKRTGVVFFHPGQSYSSCKGHGFTDEQWQRVSHASDDLLEGVRKASEEVNAEYVFPRLRRLLRDVRVYYLFPMRSHEELVGALLIGEKLAEDAFRDEDFEFLLALSAQVAPAVENAFLYSKLAHQERLRHELEIARRIQMESLPQFTPSIEGLDIAGISIPAFEVGGDYFDYLDGQPRRFAVMVGDVSGKGTSAALYMSKLQGIVRSLHAFDLSPHQLFVRTNDLLSRDLERRSFVTAIGGFFDLEAREMVLARAGHLPLYYYASETAQVHRLLPRGLGLGLSTRPMFDAELEEIVIRYRQDDVFLFITDGITECPAPSGEDFGEERVVELLKGHAHAGAREIRDSVTDAARAFAASAEQFDDQTVVVVKATA